MECHLYAGRTQQARDLLLDDWPAIRRSLFTRKSQMQRTVLYYARGRTALAEWLRQPNDIQLRQEIAEYAMRLVKLRSPWGDALSRILRAGFSAGLERRSEAIGLLAEAEDILREQNLQLLTASVARRRGELEGDSARIESADTFMRSEGVLRPDRMAAMYLPGKWL